MTHSPIFSDRVAWEGCASASPSYCPSQRVRNPFEGRNAQADEEHTPASKHDDLVSAVVSGLRALDPWGQPFFMDGHKHGLEGLLPIVSRYPALTPSQIHMALDNLTDKPMVAGFYVTGLIQRSYDAGHNDFVVGSHVDLIWLGFDLRGEAARPLRMRVQGDVRNHLLFRAHHCDVEVAGDVGSECCFCAHHCNLRVAGNMASFAGKSARYSSFIGKEAGPDLGEQAKYCTFTVDHAYTPIGEGAERCCFRINALSRLTHREPQIPKISYHNKYYLPHDALQTIRHKLDLECLMGRVMNAVWYRNRVEELKPSSGEERHAQR